MILFRRNRVLLTLLVVACLIPAVSCRQARPHRVMILGLDALDWEEVDILRGQGLLPNIDKLIRTGVSATIETNDVGGSAVYWTSIATGQTSDKHGITDFVFKDPKTGEISPVTSNQRRTKAFWNILSERNIPVGVVGWYVSWPAEKVKGFQVSSYFTWTDVQPTVKGMYYSQVPDMIFPPSLAKSTETDVAKAQEIYKGLIGKIIPLRNDGLRGDRTIKSEWSILSDLIYAEIGLHLLRQERPSVFAVYLGGVDVVGHLFTMKTKRRQMRQITRKFGDVQANYYRTMDDLIGPYLAEAGAETNIFLLSDHGLMRGEHTERGVCLMAGPDFRDNARLEKRVKLTDICPTLLYLSGLPVAEDMDGRVALDALEPAFIKSHRLMTISSYGPRTDASAQPIKTNFDKDIIDRLKTLGYLK